MCSNLPRSTYPVETDAYKTNGWSFGISLAEEMINGASSQ
jgi:hypothetical protein